MDQITNRKSRSTNIVPNINFEDNIPETYDFTHYIFKALSHKQRKSKKDMFNLCIIDDSRDDVNLFIDILETESDLKYKFHQYFNPYEAIQDLNNGLNPDVVVLDLVMPSINGMMILNKMREKEKTKDIPIVIHSSMHVYESILKVNKLGAHAFFEKPIDAITFQEYLLG